MCGPYYRGYYGVGRFPYYGAGPYYGGLYGGYPYGGFGGCGGWGYGYGYGGYY